LAAIGKVKPIFGMRGRGLRPMADAVAEVVAVAHDGSWHEAADLGCPLFGR
jgi:hypothetical protein